MTALQTLFEFYASLGDEDWPAIWFFLILIFRTARRPIKAIRRDVQLILLIMVSPKAITALHITPTSVKYSRLI